MYAYSNYECKQQLFNEFIVDQMEKSTESTITKLSQFVIHKSISVKDFALTLAYGYFDSYEPAENLAKQLDLGKIEFLAMMDNFDAFKVEYMKEVEFKNEMERYYEQSI